MTITIPSPSLGSWKTNVAGAISGGYGFLQLYKIHDWHAIYQDPQVFLAFVIALGFFNAKDNNMTGGSKGQASSSQALLDSNVAPSPVKPPSMNQGLKIT